MTTVLALNKPGFGTVIASDTRISYCGVIGPSISEGKWIIHDNWAMGYAGAFRTFNILKENADELFEDLTSAFVFANRVKDLLIEYGFEPTKDPDEVMPIYNCQMILTDGTNIYEINADMSVQLIPPGRLCAIGSGGSFASAAGYAISNITDPVKRVEKAYETALAFDSASGGDICMYVLKSNKKNETGLRMK